MYGSRPAAATSTTFSQKATEDSVEESSFYNSKPFTKEEEEMFSGTLKEKNICENTVQLLLQKMCRHIHNRSDSHRILGCQRRNRTHRIDAICHHSFNIGLYSGPAAAVTARNCQCCLHMLTPFPPSSRYAVSVFLWPPEYLSAQKLR